MSNLKLTVLSLRYSSWSMRPWLALTQAGARFETETVALPHMHRVVDASADSTDPAEIAPTPLSERRALGSVHGLFPVLRVDGVPIHESLAICEYVADTFPEAGLWPRGSTDRARARAISCEMVGGFLKMREEMSCHLFGRVPDFSPSAPVLADISRVFEIWNECLDRSGGPFLFGKFSIADAMYFPVLTRFRTYGIPLTGHAAEYAVSLDTSPAVQQLIKIASEEPRIPVYDDYVSRLGGDPDGALPG